MKFFIGSLFFLLFTQFSFAQVNQKDSKGLKQGEWQKNYPKSNVLEFKGQFKNDKPVGTFTYYYPSNKVKAIIKHDAVSKYSEAYFYHENGQVMTYGKYYEFKRDSLWYQFKENGKLIFTENFKTDSLHGVRTTYYSFDDDPQKKEKVSSIANYSNGLLDGEYSEYFDFGGARAKGTYLNGRKHGVWEDYQPTGKHLAFTRYKNGVKHGWCMAYDPSGKEVSRVYYYKGQLKEGKDLEFLMKQMKEKGMDPNE
jgi:antitoxin component YwqK of YwqJK toxin-antitoxin module